MRSGRDIARDVPMPGAARLAEVAMFSTHVAKETKEKVAVRRFLVEVIGEGNLALMDDLVAPEGVLHHPDAPGPIAGREAIKQFIGEFRVAFPDLRLDVTHLLAEGNSVAAMVTCSGTHAGPFMGYAPTNRRASWTATNFFHMEDDKIREDWVCEDTLGLLRQLGLYAA